MMIEIESFVNFFYFFNVDLIKQSETFRPVTSDHSKLLISISTLDNRYSIYSIAHRVVKCSNTQTKDSSAIYH